MARARIVLADDHADFLAIAAQMIEPEFEVVKSFSDSQSLLHEIVSLDPDLLVLDISMPGLTGIEVALHIQASACKSRIVFLTVHQDAEYLRSALATGALGYVVKSRMVSDLIPAIRTALAGRCFVSSSVSG